MKPPEQVKLVLAAQWLAKADQDIKAAAARYNVFVLVNGADEDVLFYKHTSGCGR